MPTIVSRWPAPITNDSTMIAAAVSLDARAPAASVSRRPPPRVTQRSPQPSAALPAGIAITSGPIAKHAAIKPSEDAGIPISRARYEIIGRITPVAAWMRRAVSRRRRRHHGSVCTTGTASPRDTLTW
jgi:hypothetical protein